MERLSPPSRVGKVAGGDSLRRGAGGLGQPPGQTRLTDLLAAWAQRVRAAEEALARHQAAIDAIAYRLYGIAEEDRAAIEASLRGGNGAAATASAEDAEAGEADEGDEAAAPAADPRALVGDLLSYTLGCAFGRWDVRIALDPSLAPPLAGPFDPLPVCSPGMLVGPDGLPARPEGIASEAWLRARPDVITPPLSESSLRPEGAVAGPATIPDAAYPLRVSWVGLLVDDRGHQDDIVRRVEQVLALLWGERAEAIEREACDILGVVDLRDYFRSPRGFWDHHVKRYAKSRRKAPLYWLLQSARRSYGIWLYYHRLDPALLFKALMLYTEPKVRLEEDRLELLRGERAEAGAAGSAAKRLERAVERQEALIQELRDFRQKLARAAHHRVRPDLDDGVALNIAPLHELVPWKVAKDMWDDLQVGKYAWSSIGQQPRAKEVI